MGKRVAEHIRGNVVGYVALFFAMSLGTAYAIDKNTVKSKHIRAGQVKESDLGNAAVTNAKLAANSVDGDKVVDDSLKGADVDESSLNLPAPPTAPSSLPPSGSAGGDLSGEYPNPQIGANAIGTNEVDGTLTGADIDEASLSGLVTGTGRVLTGSTSVAGGLGPVILEIPGWGEIEVGGCQANASPASRGAVMSFDSTGPSGTMWRIGGVGGVSSQASFSSASSPSIGSGTIANAEANEAIALYLTRTDSAQTVFAFATEKTGSTSCDFSAQAVIAG